MSRLRKGSVLTLGVPAVEEVKFMASNIRQSDRADMEGLSLDKTIHEMISGEMESSRAVYGLYMGGIIHGLFGVIPSGLRGVGTPWLVGTVEVDKNPLPFARVSKLLLDMLQVEFPVFVTWVCGRNKKSMLWHRWCGFKFEKEQVRLGRDLYFHAKRMACSGKIKQGGE